MTILLSTNTDLPFANQTDSDGHTGHCSRSKTKESKSLHGLHINSSDVPDLPCTGGYGFYDESKKVIIPLADVDGEVDIMNIGDVIQFLNTTIAIDLQEDRHTDLEKELTYDETTVKLHDDGEEGKEVDVQINGLSIREIVATNGKIEEAKKNVLIPRSPHLISNRQDSLKRRSIFSIREKVSARERGQHWL